MLTVTRRGKGCDSALSFFGLMRRKSKHNSVAKSPQERVCRGSDSPFFNTWRLHETYLCPNYRFAITMQRNRSHNRADDRTLPISHSEDRDIETRLRTK
jgi:hypothetical protein